MTNHEGVPPSWRAREKPRGEYHHGGPRRNHEGRTNFKERVRGGSPEYGDTCSVVIVCTSVKQVEGLSNDSDLCENFQMTYISVG
jgi:hypothetical protein